MSIPLNEVQFKTDNWERTSKGSTYSGLRVVAEHPKYGEVGAMDLHPDPDEHGNREIHDINVLVKRQGIGRGLLNHAQMDGLNPVHSAERTPDGDAWARAVGGHLPARKQIK